MSELLVRQALEKHLAAMPGVLASAFENAGFVPVDGTPYQKVDLIPAQTENPDFGSPNDHHRLIGILQVDFRYPPQAGAGDAAAQFEALKTQFPRGLSLTEGAVTVVIDRTPWRAPGRIDDGRYCVAAMIRYYADIFT